jgi:hypothetical protein
MPTRKKELMNQLFFVRGNASRVEAVRLRKRIDLANCSQSIRVRPDSF